ncbi:MAG: hypothetical protein V7641_4075 [Blastocatellia bacterium]
MAILLLAGCNRQPAPASPTNQNTEVKPIVGDAKNTNSELLKLAVVEEPLKTIASGKLADEKEVVAGSEAPKIIKLKDNLVCYSYRKYAVIVSPTDEVGEDIKVIAKIGASDESFLTDLKKAPVYFKVPEGDNFFYGIYDDLMFIDSGSGPDPRGLDIVDLSQKKNVFSGSYSQPIALDKDRRLVYYLEVDEKKLKKKPDCPEAEEWKKNNLGIAYEEKVSLDLKTLKTARSGQLRCASRQ